MKKRDKIISWIFRALLFVGFVLASVGKLTNNPQVIQMFEDWGFPNGFHFFIGIFELIIAVLILIPKTLKISIIGMVVLLIGAAITHLVNDPISNLLRPLIFFILLVGVYFLNFRR